METPGHGRVDAEAALRSRISELEGKLGKAVRVLEAVAEPFPGKPYEGWNWPDLWKNLGDMARSALKEIGEPGKVEG